MTLDRVVRAVLAVSLTVAIAVAVLLLLAPRSAPAEAPPPAAVTLASEAHQARVLPLLQQGRIAEARAAARTAVRLIPASARARMLHAWALRHVPRGLPGVYALPRATAAYGQARRLAPSTPDAACGRAWTRFAQGDRVGARRTFSRLVSATPSDDCALSGARATAARWRASGTFFLTGTAYASHPTNTGSVGTIARGRAVLDDLLFIEITGRLLAIGADVSGTKVTGSQVEAWARVGVDHAGFGVEGLAAVVKSSADAVAASVVAGRAWATFGVTLRGEAAVSNFSTGTATLAGAGLFVPVLSVLDLDAEVQLTRWNADDDAITAPAAMVSASAIVTPIPDLSLTITGRGGRAWAPIRFDQPTIWNTTWSQTAGAEVAVSGRLLPWLTLHGSWEVARLQGAAAGSTSHTHVFGLGATVETEGGMRR